MVMDEKPPTLTVPLKVVKENMRHALATAYGNHSHPWSRPLAHDQVPMFSLTLGDGWSNNPSCPCSLATGEHSPHIPRSRAHCSQPMCTGPHLLVIPTRPPDSGKFSQPRLLDEFAYSKFSWHSRSHSKASLGHGNFSRCYLSHLLNPLD